MDRMWAPWRMQYVSEISKDDGTGCVFCDNPARSDDRNDLILFRGEKSFIILNRYPYNNGHLMVVPYLHTAQITDLDEQTSSEMWRLITKGVQCLRTAYKPEGFNIGMNMGRAGGAGIDQHLHFHIVPRWGGDANFMLTIGETKVISQGLMESYDILFAIMHREPAA
jgi:ATP adenylyltransferase